MIADFDRGFVFVHIPKTGGTSVQTALVQDKSGSRGVIAAIRRKIGRKSLDEAAVSSRTKHETYQEFLSAFEGRAGQSPDRAAQLCPVAFVRDPLSRFMSLHRYLLKSHRERYPNVPLDINEWADTILQGEAGYLKDIRSLRPQVEYTAGFPASGQVGRFETLGDDFRRIFGGFGVKAELTHVNASGGPSTPNAGRAELSAATLAFVRDRYASDYDHFGYDWRASRPRVAANAGKTFKSL